MNTHSPSLWYPACLLLAGIAPLTTHSAVILWDFGADAGSLAASSPVSDAVLTVSALARGNGGSGALTSSAAASDYSGASGLFNGLASAQAGAFSVANSTYWEFSLTAGAGSSFTLTDISFGSRSTATGPTGLAVRSSLDSFGSDLAVASATANSAWALLTPALTDTTGLSGQTVSYRIYGFDGSGTASNWRLDDLELTVDVAFAPVPEPGEYAAMTGALLLGLGVWRRARRRGA